MGAIVTAIVLAVPDLFPDVLAHAQRAPNEAGPGEHSWIDESSRTAPGS
jgi:hypothetical protein